jgi:O-antigen/teichoic acid export membrane protein
MIEEKVNIIKSSTKLFTSNGLRAVISFLALIYFTKNLPSSALGSFFLFQASLGILSIPADFGLLGAIEKRISEDNSPEQVLTTALLLKLIPLSIVSILIILFQNNINEYLEVELAGWLVIGLFLLSLKELMIKVLRGEMRVGETASLQFIDKFLWAAIGIILVLNGYGTEGLVYGLLTGHAFVFLIGMYKRSTNFGLPSWEKAQSLYNYAKYNVISSTGSYVYNWMDVAMLGFFVSPSLISAYEVAWRVSSLLLMFSRSIATSLFPQISSWEIDGKYDEIESILPKTLFFTLLFVIPGFFGISILSKQILTIIFTPEYAVAWVALIILSAERLFHSIHMILGRTLNGINRPNLAARATVASLLINLVLNAVLISQFGIIGAALATSISFIVNAYLHAKYLSNYIDISVDRDNMSWLLFSSVLMSFVVLVIAVFISVDTLTILLLYVLIGAITFSLVMLVKKSVRKEVINITNSIL